MAEPAYRGFGIGAGIKGRHTATSSGVDPETTAIIRRQLADGYSALANAQTKIQMEMIESQSNIMVALSNSYARSLGAMSQAAQAGAMGLRAKAEMLQQITPMFTQMISMANGGVSLGVSKKIQAQQTQLTNSLNQQNRVLIDKVKSLPPAQAAEAIKQAYARSITEGFANSLSSTMGPELRGASPGQRFHLKSAAGAAATSATEDAYSRLIVSLQQGGNRALASALHTGLRTGVVAHSVDSGFGGDQNFTIYGTERQAATSDQDKSRKFLNDYYETAMSAGAGVPPEMFHEMMTLHRDAKAIADGGIEAYSEQISKMPTPPLISKAIQELDRVQELLDPEDALTKAVRSYASTIPNFYHWAAAMNFTNPVRAVQYARKHPEDIMAFIRIQKEHPEVIVGGDEPPIELQRRLRQEGVAQTEGTIKKKFLSKRLERIFGFGIEPSDGYRLFPGDTTEAQLDQAIAYANQGIGVLDKEVSRAATSVQGDPGDMAADADADREDDLSKGVQAPDETPFFDRLTPEAKDALMARNLDDPDAEQKRIQFLERLKTSAEEAKERLYPDSEDEGFDLFKQKEYRVEGVRPPQPAAPAAPTTLPSTRPRGGGPGAGTRDISVLPYPPPTPPPTPPPVVATPNRPKTRAEYIAIAISGPWQYQGHEMPSGEAGRIAMEAILDGGTAEDALALLTPPPEPPEPAAPPEPVAPVAPVAPAEPVAEDGNYWTFEGAPALGGEGSTQYKIPKGKQVVPSNRPWGNVGKGLGRRANSSTLPTQSTLAFDIQRAREEGTTVGGVTLPPGEEAAEAMRRWRTGG